jgi:hypothetical protein
MRGVTLPTETVFVMEMSPIKFGLGATDEIAYDARRLGLSRVLIFTDRHIAELGLPERIIGRPTSAPTPPATSGARRRSSTSAATFGARS